MDVAVNLELEGKTRSSSLWFEDGNVVLASDTLLFRVHRGVLARHSTFFAGLFTLPQPDAAGDAYEGVPMVTLHGDKGDDMQHLLHCLYDFAYYHSSKPSTSEIVSALLLLSTKYDVECVRNEAIKHLELRFPSSRAAYQSYFVRDEDFRPFEFEDRPPYDWLRLAREVNAEVLLPILYYEVATQPLHDILSLSSSGGLFGNDLKTILLGREALHKRNKEKIVSLINGKAAAACLIPETCNLNRRIQGTMPPVWLETEAHCNLRLFTISVDDLFMDCWRGHLCSVCLRAFRGSYQAELDKTWKNLPGYFGLPAWEILRTEA